MNKLTEFLVKPFLNEDILEEGARDPGIFKAIFLAGGPGSGKSYVASQLFGIPEKINVSKTGLKMVNQDSELEFLLNKYFVSKNFDITNFSNKKINFINTLSIILKIEYFFK